MTVDGFRRLALAMPEALEVGHMGHPDFRVRGRGRRGATLVRLRSARTPSVRTALGAAWQGVAPRKLVRKGSPG